MNTGLIIILLTLLGWAIVMYWANKKDRRRTKALNKVAVSLNLTFIEIASDSVEKLLSSFHIVPSGYLSTVNNAMGGQYKDIKVVITDYYYEETEWKTMHQTLIIINSSELHLPLFTLQPKLMRHKIGRGHDSQDVNFESYQIFSNQCLLRGPDEKAIRHLFSEKIIRYFETKQNLFIEGDGTVLLMYRKNELVAPKNIDSYLEEAYKVFALLKMESGYIFESKEQKRTEHFWNRKFATVVQQLQSEKYQLEKLIECPACGQELELEDNERKTKKFTCPNCRNEFNLVKDSQLYTSK